MSRFGVPAVQAWSLTAESVPWAAAPTEKPSSQVSASVPARVTGTAVSAVVVAEVAVALGGLLTVAPEVMVNESVKLPRAERTNCAEIWSADTW